MQNVKDIHNVNEFFRKKKVNVLTVKELFDFVVDLNIDENNEEAALEKLNEKASLRTEDERSAQEIVEAEVFKKIFIPRQLMDVNFPERAISNVNKDETEPVYKSVTGVQLQQKANETPEFSDKDEDDKSQIKSDFDSSTSSNEDDNSKFKDSHRPRNESPNSRKERKKALKAETAEKRKSKVKKHVKKRKEKVSSTKKK